MDDTPRHNDTTAAKWGEVLAESEAEAAAGLFVSGDAIIRELRRRGREVRYTAELNDDDLASIAATEMPGSQTQDTYAFPLIATKLSL